MTAAKCEAGLICERSEWHIWWYEISAEGFAYSHFVRVAEMAVDWMSMARTLPVGPTHFARNAVSWPFPQVASITESPRRRYFESRRCRTSTGPGGYMTRWREVNLSKVCRGGVREVVYR